MPATETSEVIETGKIYSLAEFMRRVNWGRHAMRKARQKGLKTIFLANRVYVSGDDAVSFFLEQATSC